MGKKELQRPVQIIIKKGEWLNEMKRGLDEEGISSLTHDINKAGLSLSSIQSTLSTEFRKTSGSDEKVEI